jgi:hypothetical protein
MGGSNREARIKHARLVTVERPMPLRQQCAADPGIGDIAPLAAPAIRAFSSVPAAGCVKKCDKTRF